MNLRASLVRRGVSLAVWLSASACLCWGTGCRCEIRIGGSGTEPTGGRGQHDLGTVGQSPVEAQVKEAARALEAGRAKEAVDLALQGIVTWTRRAGYGFGRTAPYRKVLHQALRKKAGLERLLARCSGADTAMDQKVCGLVLGEHFRLAVRRPELRPSAKVLFVGLCLDESVDLYAKACQEAEAAALAASKELRAVLGNECSKGAQGRRAWCGKVAGLGWRVGLIKWNVDLLAAAGDVLVREDPAAGLAFFLEAAYLRGPAPKEVAKLAKTLLLRVLGTPDGLRALPAVVSTQFGPDQRRRLLEAVLADLEGREAEVASALDLVDRQEAEHALALLRESERGAAYATRVRRQLKRTGGRALVESYIRTGRGGARASAQVASYLRAHPTFLEEVVLAQAATLPAGPRRRVRDLVRRIRPDVLYGGVTGLVDPASQGSGRCFLVFLQQARDCTPTPKRPRGGRKRWARPLNSRGGFEIRRLPFGPYHMWVRCRGRSAVPVSSYAMVVGRRRSLRKRCPVVVLPGTMTTLDAVSLDVFPGGPVGSRVSWLGGPRSVP